MSTSSAIDINKLRDEVLSDGAGDYFGVYEIIWSLNGHYPDVGREQKISAARTVALLQEDKISLFKTVWASNRYDPVSKDEALRSLRSDDAWKDPTEDPYFCYAAAFYEGPSVKPSGS